MRTSTPRAARTTSISAYVTATPAAPAMPMKNGDRRSNRGPGLPSGCAAVLMRAAPCSAARIGCSCAEECGWAT